MKPIAVGRIVLFGLLWFVAVAPPAPAAERLGTGNASLLGGDLTDPTDAVKEKDGVNYGHDKPEDELRPVGGNWVRMKCAPTSPPGTAPHQRHAYQSWQGSPACAVFLNNPEKRKWYVGFKDGGNGGPTEDEPYYCAVEFKDAFTLTHFTTTTAPDMPDRDPKVWAIQGSNTGRDDDWTDIYRCDPKDRERSPLREKPRNETTLFTAFTSTDMAKVVTAKDLKSLQTKLKDKSIAKADFPFPKKTYTWFRVAVYSCFNPNGNEVADVRFPPGFSLGQLELFGVQGAKEPPAPPKPKVLVKPPVSDLPFIITYWCGPPKSETTLERYQEIADAGFNVAFPAIDVLWAPLNKENEEHNRKYLDLCQKAGLKALVWDGGIPGGKGWNKPTPDEVPQIEKALDGIIGRYSAHPAMLGYVVSDEPGVESFPRLGLVNRYLLKRDPKHLPYINLLPAYAGPPGNAWRLPKYKDTVAKYVDEVKPALVSWDHYRQMFEGGDESTYWHNLEIIRKLCVKTGVPYNQIIVSLKHMGYRECSEVDLRWQVYTSVAFGSRGITYFTYWDVKELAWAGAPAIMTLDGKRDKKYDSVKKINHRIAALGPTLVKLVCTGAYCTDPLPPGGVRLPEDAAVTRAEGGPLLIGCFNDADGKRYTFPVNRSFKDKIKAKLTLDGRVVSVAEVSQETGKHLDPVPLTDGTLTVTLEPGEGKLFRVNDKGLLFDPPAEIFGGKDLDLTNIAFTPEKPDGKATGKLFWRRKGEAKFTELPLEVAAKDRFKVTLSAAVTAAPFEYYLEVQEVGEKPVREPAQGALLAVPDLTPPTTVPELAVTTVKSYRVSLAWKAATDDRGVAGYRVYRGAADRFALDERALLGKLPADAITYTDEAPTPKAPAWYAVQAVDVVGRAGEVRYLRVDVPDHQPPANGLKVEALPGSKSVVLTWSGELEPNVTALEIHRGEGKDGELKKVGEVTDPKASRYLDKETKFGTEYRYAVRPRSSAGLLGEPGKVVTASPLRYLKRINCGGPEIAAEDGVAWEADTGDGHAALKYSGSRVWTLEGDTKKDVYQSERWSNNGIGYAFEVEPGRYEVVLLFAETNATFAGKGKRLFDIEINAKKVAEKVDVFTEAGGATKPWQFRKVVDVTGKELEIKLLANPTGPAIKGIEIRGLPAK